MAAARPTLIALIRNGADTSKSVTEAIERCRKKILKDKEKLRAAEDVIIKLKEEARENKFLTEAMGSRLNRIILKETSQAKDILEKGRLISELEDKLANLKVVTNIMPEKPESEAEVENEAAQEEGEGEGKEEEEEEVQVQVQAQEDRIEDGYITRFRLAKRSQTFSWEINKANQTPKLLLSEKPLKPKCTKCFACGSPLTSQRTRFTLKK